MQFEAILEMLGPETAITTGPVDTLLLDFMDCGDPALTLQHSPPPRCHVTNEQLIISLKHKYRLPLPVSVAAAGV